MKTLVVGCDASGKSTFLDHVKNIHGDLVGEASRSDEAQDFKRANISRLVDLDFINQRESMYLNLSKQALAAMTRRGGDVVTTDSSLVTRLSHNVMRKLIGSTDFSNDVIIEQWLEDEMITEASPPDLFVLTHSNFSIIHERIIRRQKAGDEAEKFWGFNSPFFLEAYQERWQSMLESLSRASFTCLTIDTGTVTPGAAIQKYTQLRLEKTKKVY